MDPLTTALSGFSIGVIGLCALRTFRTRNWGAISRVAHLRDKNLNGQVSYFYNFLFGYDCESGTR